MKQIFIPSSIAELTITKLIFNRNVHFYLDTNCMASLEVQLHILSYKIWDLWLSTFSLKIVICISHKHKWWFCRKPLGEKGKEDHYIRKSRQTTSEQLIRMEKMKTKITLPIRRRVFGGDDFDQAVCDLHFGW